MTEKQVMRIGQVIRVKAEKLEEYKKLHANAWEGVL
jgi:L-rhamnose mutarotase